MSIYYIFLALSLVIADKTKPKIIYVGDPMCSWCYGIGPELTKLQTHFSDKIEFELIMGGLRPFNTETMFDLKDFLTHHWEDVSKASGQKFNFDILDNKSITYDTEPPSRAIQVFKHLCPRSEFDIFHLIQKTFYLDNKNMHLAESYKDITDQYDIDFNEFKQLFNDESFKLDTKKQFKKAGELGVRSFPTIILIHNDKSKIIAQGYSTAENMIDLINSNL